MTSCFQCFVKVAAGAQSKFEDYWLQISGIWLTISKKVGQQAFFLLPLDLAHLGSGEETTRIPNSIMLKTSQITGSHEIYIASSSRIEIILLFQALQTGWDQMKNLPWKEKQEVACDYHVSHGLLGRSKQGGQLVLTPQELRIGDKEAYPIHELVSLSFKQNDPNCKSRLVLTVNTSDGKKQREFHVHELQAMELVKSMIKRKPTA